MFKLYRRIKRGEYIVLGVDGSVGGGDRTAGQFLSKNYIDAPLVYHSKGMLSDATPLLYNALCWIHDITGIRPLVAYERNNGGAFEMERLAALNRKHKFDIFKMPQFIGREGTPDDVKYGWDTNTATRPIMLGELKSLVDKRVLMLYDEETIQELFSFIVVQTSTAWKAQAEGGAHDDLVIALAIAVQLFIRSKTAAAAQDDDNYANRQFNYGDTITARRR